MGPIIRGSVAPSRGTSSITRALCTYGYLPRDTYVPLPVRELVAARCKTIVPQHMPAVASSEAASTPEELSSCVEFLRTECAKQLGRAVRRKASLSRKAPSSIISHDTASVSSGEGGGEAEEQEETAVTSPRKKTRRLSEPEPVCGTQEIVPLGFRRGVWHLLEKQPEKKRQRTAGSDAARPCAC